MSLNSLTLSGYFAYIVLELVVIEKNLKNPIHLPPPSWVFFLIKHSIYFLNWYQSKASYLRLNRLRGNDYSIKLIYNSSPIGVPLIQSLDGSYQQNL